MTSSARLVGLLLLAAAQTQAHAQSAAPAVPDALHARVVAAVAERWSVAAASVRLDWSTFHPRHPIAENATFRLLGAGDDGWFAVVFESTGAPAEAARLRAGLEDSVAVATRPLVANATLADGDLVKQARVRWQSPSRARIATTGAAVGWRTRRALAKGDALEGLAVAPPAAVTAGAPVRLEWSRGDVAIQLAGTALNTAAIGEAVHVRVDGRPGQTSGIATAPGLVRLGS